jgi:hypothetical protein
MGHPKIWWFQHTKYTLIIPNMNFLTSQPSFLRGIRLRLWDMPWIQGFCSRWYSSLAWKNVRLKMHLYW